MIRNDNFFQYFLLFKNTEKLKKKKKREISSNTNTNILFLYYALSSYEQILEYLLSCNFLVLCMTPLFSSII